MTEFSSSGSTIGFSIWDAFSPNTADFKEAEKTFHDTLSWERQALVVMASIVGGTFFCCWGFSGISLGC